MTPTRRHPLLCALAVFAAAALVLPACQKKKAPPPKVIRPVRYVKVTDNKAAQRRRFAGVAQAGEESRLSFRVAGSLTEVPVKVGDRVKKGAPIAKLDSRDYALQVQEASAGLAQAKAQERNADASYKRARALYENQNASRQELDSARAAAESAAMQVRSIEQRLQLARRQLTYCAITAPDEGVISEVFVEPNENVSPGQPVASLQSGGELEVRVALPESLIAHVERDQAVDVRFDAIPGRTFAGQVFEVGVSGGRSTTFPVTVRLAEPDGAIRPGMAADVDFNFAASEDAARHRVPSVAVGEDRSGRFVYVLQPTGKGLGEVQRRAVTTGKLSSQGLEVLDGLKDGELIVTAGIHQIHDGLTVRVPERSTP